MSQLYVYRWNRMERKGQECRVLSRGKMNSCLVEFLDGFKAVTSRNALRKGRMESQFSEADVLKAKLLIGEAYELLAKAFALLTPKQAENRKASE